MNADGYQKKKKNDTIRVEWRGFYEAEDNMEQRFE